MKRESGNSRQYAIGNRQSHISFASLVAAIVLALLFFLQLNPAFGQPTLDPSFKTYGLDQEEDNVIHNAAHLDDFFEALYRQQTFNDRKISIVHIGDSHIQADYLTNITRRNFQQRFGNAGRGLIVPTRLAATNGPFNVVTDSNIKWNSKRCVHPDAPLPIGIGGITIHTDKANATIGIYMNDLWLDYSFNNVTVFFQPGLMSYHLSVADTTGNMLAFINALPPQANLNYSRVTLPYAVSAMRLQTIKQQADQRDATLFGLSLENGKNGILYHAIGVNGARYAHYNAAQMFATQTAALQPHLFILSLGTNEAIYYPTIEKNFINEIDRLITSLRINNPGAAFVLVTPPDAFRKKTKHNPGVAIIRDQIIQYAVENGLAFYDMYRALGGEGSAEAWRAAGLLRTDGVHFTKEGYEYQGNLLFKAFLKSFNQHVSVRHP